MPIFTIVAAHPVDVQLNELPRVRVDSFIVEADSLFAAHELIADWEGIADATEVFGIENKGPLILTPANTHRREEELAQWEHWSRMVAARELAPWQLLARGPESFRERIARQFAERRAWAARAQAIGSAA